MGALDHPELLRRHRLTVDQFHRMGEAGVIGPEVRVELLDAEVVEMVPIGARHAGTVNRLTRRVTAGVGDDAVVAVQNPLRLDDHSEPQPDLMPLAPRADCYASAHPTPADVAPAALPQAAVDLAPLLAA